MNIKKKAIRNGIIAIAIILFVNFLVLYSLNFPLMATEIIKKYFFLLILLIGGFGFQVGLFTYLKSASAIGCSTSIASGGISSISMIICCSHYLLNILPFLGALIGISALSFLSKYTIYFLLFGIMSNVIGTGIMLYQAKRKKYGK